MCNYFTGQIEHGCISEQDKFRGGKINKPRCVCSLCEFSRNQMCNTFCEFCEEERIRSQNFYTFIIFLISHSHL